MAEGRAAEHFPGFAVFSFGVFYFHGTSSVDIWNKYHGRGDDLAYVAGIVAGSADHGTAGTSEILSNFRYPFYQFFGKSHVGHIPGLTNLQRTTPLFSDSFETFLHVLPCPDSQIFIPGTSIHGEMDLTRDIVMAMIGIFLASLIT
jgi:hypothetical protein